MIAMIILVFVHLAVLGVWIPRNKMMRDMKRMDEREEMDVLDNLAD